MSCVNCKNSYIKSFKQQCVDTLTEIECNHHNHYKSIEDHINNIIRMIAECFECNGYLESEYNITDQTEVIALILQYHRNGSCLKCAMFIGCQITDTFAKNKSFSNSCKLLFHPNGYNNNIYILTQKQMQII